MTKPQDIRQTSSHLWTSQPCAQNQTPSCPSYAFLFNKLFPHLNHISWTETFQLSIYFPPQPQGPHSAKHRLSTSQIRITAAMAYVPPAVRTKQLQEVVKKTGTDLRNDNHVHPPSDVTNPRMTAEPAHKRLPSHFDIHNHYWPERKDSTNDRQLASTDGVHHSTLNGSAEVPDQLKYIMLFHDANPRWKSNGIIFVKSSLQLLPGSERFDHQIGKKGDSVDGKAAPSTNSQDISSIPNDENPTIATEQEDTAESSTYTPDLSRYDRGPIAVFEQLGGRKGGFEFAGYHKISRLQFLEPFSDELQRMLMQKFSKVDKHGQVTQQQRSRNAWEASMRHRWAVMKLDKDEEAGIPDPDIEVGEVKADDGKLRASKKGVNELLREMRIKEEAPVAEVGTKEQPLRCGKHNE